MSAPTPPPAPDEPETPRRRQRALVATLVLALLGAAAVGWWLADRPAERPEPAANAQPTPTPTPALAPTLTPSPTPTKRPACADQTNEPFTPARISIPEVASGATVISPPRDSAGVPGTPPLTSSGKQEFAWDSALAPGSKQGNVLLNAHTWPDGSALGNRMLAHLQEGDRIVVRGEGKTLCYRVTRRIEVLASDGYPPYYDAAGPPQLAVVVCSGRRVGPGDWTHRTLWFASPVRSG